MNDYTNIPQGYKQTELGVIPEDWEIMQLGDIGIFSKGNSISRTESNSGNIPCVRYGEIYTAHDIYIKKFYSFISKDIAKHSKLLKNGDILFAASGETKEDIGKCVAFISNREAYAGGDIIILTPNINNFDGKYLGFILNTSKLSKQKASKGQGDAVVHITTESLSKLIVPIPATIKEQRAIAKALSDVDALIAALDKKIAKKRLIKQGAMQQLLTGKKRIQGFTDEWATKKLREIIDVYKGEQLNRSLLFDNAIGYPVMNGGIAPSGYYLHSNCMGNIIIISEGGNSCGYVNYMNAPFWAGGHCYIVVPRIDIDLVFLYTMLKFKEDAMMALRTGSGLPNIQKNRLLDELSLSVPASQSEQQAIATILSNMDKEIADLEARRDKYKLVKSGMMQKLLTGQIRLKVK